MDPSVAWIVIPIQIFCLDLLLGADNALVIALACRSLHAQDMRKGLVLGLGGAIVIRLLATLMASFLLSLPGVKIAGALVLMAVAVNLVAGDRLGGADSGQAAASRASAPRRSLWSAALIITLADAAMSFDNVVALAAIARGSFWLLAAGVLLSLPVLAFGGLILSVLLRSFPALVATGCGLLGWIAGDMAIGDPLIADWANAQAPALVLVAPALAALFVLAKAQFAAADRRRSTGEPAGGAVRLAPDLAGLFAATPPTVSPTIVARAAVAAAPALDLGPRKARRGATREDRIMLAGLVLLFFMAAAMIGFVMYMVQSYAVERFS